MGIVPINERKTVYIKIVKAPEGGYKGTTKYGIKTNGQSTVDTSVNGYIFVTEDGTEIKSPTINSFSTSGGENSINVTLDINYKNGATENKCYYSIYDNSKWSNYIEGNIKENVCTFEVSPYKDYSIKAYVVDSRGVSSETFKITGKASNEIPKPVIKIIKPDSEEEFTENDPTTFEYKGDIWYPYGTKIKIVYPEDMTNLSGTYSRKYVFGSYTNSNSWTASAGDNNIITATETVTYYAKIEDRAGEVVEADPLTIHILPRDINGLENQSYYTSYCVGQVLPVIATGKKSRTIYGTDIYRYNSDIGTAAMHMGLVNEEETYRGYIKIIGTNYYFKSSERNGITSNEYKDLDASYIFVNEDGTPINAKGEITSNQPDENNITLSLSNSVAYTDKDGNNWYPYGTKLTITYSGEGKKSYTGTMSTNNNYTSTDPVEFTFKKAGKQAIIARITDTSTNEIIHEKSITFCIMPNATGGETDGYSGFDVYPVLLQGSNDSESTGVWAGYTKNTYKTNSNKQKAAIHLGILKPGEGNKIAFIKYDFGQIYSNNYNSASYKSVYGIERNGIEVSSSSVYCGNKSAYNGYYGYLYYFYFVDEYGNTIAPFDLKDVTLSENNVINSASSVHGFTNEGNAIVPTNMSDTVANSTAESYIDLDLTSYEPSDIIKITLNAYINFTANHYGTVSISTLKNNGEQATDYGNIIYRSSTSGEIVSDGTIEEENNYTKRVTGGKKYRISFTYTNEKNDNEFGTMRINSLTTEKVENDIKIVPVDETVESYTDKDGKIWYPWNTKFKIQKESDDTVYYHYYKADGTSYGSRNSFNENEKEITLNQIMIIKFGYTYYNYENSDSEYPTAEIICYIMPYLHGYNYGHFDSYNIGKIYPVKVKRNTSSSIYGTEIYEYNTNIDTAATHMGLLDDEEEKYVYIKIVSSPEGGYMGTTKNGITSSARKNSVQNGFIFVTEDGTEILEPIINSGTASMYDINKIAVVVDAIGKNGTTIEKYYYSIDNGEYIEETNNTYTFTVENPNSIHIIRIYVRDSNGVLSQTKEVLTSATKGAPTITLTDEDGNPVQEDQIVHWNGEDWYPYKTKLTINYAEDMTNFYGDYAYIDERTDSMSNWRNISDETYTTYLYYSVTYMAKIEDKQTGEETEEVSLKINIMPSQSNGANYYYSYLGNIYPVQVTGTTSGYAYGTDVYTYDSNINSAATHMGLVDIGETDVVYIKIVQAPEGGYKSSTRNGITTESTTSIQNGFIFVDKDGNEITRPKVNSITTALGDKSITVTVNASSNNATIEKYYYTIDNIGEYVELTDNHYTFTNIEISGPHKIKVYVKDSNNNLSAIKEIEGRRNIPKPIFTFNKDPIDYNGEKWYPYNTTLTINYSDDSMSYLTGYYRNVNVHKNSMSPSVTSWYSTSSLNVSETLNESYIYEAYIYENGVGEGEHTREKINIMPNPEGLQSNYYNYGSGNTYPVQVTGTTSGKIYGTTIYRRDSNINTAATHMGLVGVGETKVVYIKIVPCPEGGYVSSTQNEITSTASTSSYVGFTFVQ